MGNESEESEFASACSVCDEPLPKVSYAILNVSYSLPKRSYSLPTVS